MANEEKKSFSFTNLHGKYKAHGPSNIPAVTKEFSKYKNSTDPEDLAAAIRDAGSIGFSDFTKHMKKTNYTENQLVRTAKDDLKKGFAKSIIGKLKIIDYDSLKHIIGLDVSKIDDLQSGKAKLSNDTIDDLIRHYGEFSGIDYNNIINQFGNRKLKTLYNIINGENYRKQEQEALGKLEDKLEDYIFSGVNPTHFRTYHVAEAKKKGITVDQLHFSSKSSKEQRQHHYMLANDQMPAKKEYEDYSWKLDK